MSLHIIGDVHGKFAQYKKLIGELSSDDYSVQLGDMGFKYEAIADLNSNHRWFAGNHDNYTSIENSPPANYLADWGDVKLGGDFFFFIRGGCSVDKMRRTPYINWWPQEELSVAQFDALIEHYKRSRPELVISHECPACVIPLVADDPGRFHPSFTARGLDTLLLYHRPKMWVFGHHHKSFEYDDGRTTYIGLAELEVFKYEQN